MSLSDESFGKELPDAFRAIIVGSGIGEELGHLGVLGAELDVIAAAEAAVAAEGDALDPPDTDRISHASFILAAAVNDPGMRERANRIYARRIHDFELLFGDSLFSREATPAEIEKLGTEISQTVGELHSATTVLRQTGQERYEKELLPNLDKHRINIVSEQYQDYSPKARELRDRLIGNGTGVAPVIGFSNHNLGVLPPSFAPNPLEITYDRMTVADIESPTHWSKQTIFVDGEMHTETVRVPTVTTADGNEVTVGKIIPPQSELDAKVYHRHATGIDLDELENEVLETDVFDGWYVRIKMGPMHKRPGEVHTLLMRTYRKPKGEDAMDTQDVNIVTREYDNAETVGSNATNERTRAKSTRLVTEADIEEFGIAIKQVLGTMTETVISEINEIRTINI